MDYCFKLNGSANITNITLCAILCDVHFFYLLKTPSFDFLGFMDTFKMPQNKITCGSSKKRAPR